MKTIISAALRATATVAAALLLAWLVGVVGMDKFEAWYRAYSPLTQLVAIAFISLVTGGAATIGFRAAASSLRQTKPTGTLTGATAILAVCLFLMLSGREYSGNIGLPLLGLAAVVIAAAFYLGRVDRRAASRVV